MAKNKENKDKLKEESVDAQKDKAAEEKSNKPVIDVRDKEGNILYKGEFESAVVFDAEGHPLAKNYYYSDSGQFQKL